MKKILEEVKDIVKNDPTKELVNFLKEDSERQAKRDDMFMTMMYQMMMTGHGIQRPSFSSQPPYQMHSQSHQPHHYDHHGMTWIQALNP